MLGAALLLAAVWSVAGCGDGSQTKIDPEARKLVIIGIDSADWALLDPMIAVDRMPNLKAFRDQSTYGRMHTFLPLQKSPRLWASISTGVRPEVHGIANFVSGSKQEPVRGSAWHAPALWDILGAADMSTAVIGMWSTYPARPINGVMVSDYLPYGSKRLKPMANLASPDSLSAIFAAMRVDPASLGAAELGRFIDADHLAEFDEKYPRQMEALRDFHAADLTYLAVARQLAADNDFDLFFYYLRGPDMISHKFFEYHKPDNMRLPPSADKLAAFSGVVENYYDWSDEVLGEVLSWFPADRQTVIVSDHGFYGPRRNGDKGAKEHSEWGIFLVRSPLYEAGHGFGHLKLLDVCPTLLALMGLPAGQDMPGVVLAEGLTPDGLKRVQKLEKSRVETYMPLAPVAGPVGESDAGVNEEIRKQLRSLGYIN